jgi:hypothetical protein
MIVLYYLSLIIVVLLSMEKGFVMILFVSNGECGLSILLGRICNDLSVKVVVLSCVLWVCRNCITLFVTKCGGALIHFGGRGVQ